jgi:branched-chain amino acid transport system permease protein
MSFESLIFEVIILGLISGGIYALVAVGFSLIYGVMGIINIAHGDFFAFGAYISFLIIAFSGMPFLAFIISMGAVFVVGMVIEKGLFERLRLKLQRASLTDRRNGYLILSFGISICLQNSFLAIAGSDYYSVPGFLSGTIKFFTIPISIQRVIVFTFSIILLSLLFLLLRSTKLGLSIRAVSQNSDIARSLGVDANRVNMITFGMAAALASAAGALITPITNVFPTVGWPFTIKAIAIIILGGVGNPLGALIGSFGIGIIEAFGVQFIGAQFRDAIAFLVIIFMLLLKPSGLLGR